MFVLPGTGESLVTSDMLLGLEKKKSSFLKKKKMKMKEETTKPRRMESMEGV